MSTKIRQNIDDFYKRLNKDLKAAERIGGNRAGKRTVAQTVRIVRVGYNVKAASVRKALKLRTASRSDERISIYVRQEAIGMIDFNARQVKAGVRYEIRRGKTMLRKSAFIRAMHGGGRQVYERYGPAVTRVMPGNSIYAGKVMKRQKIRKVAGMSVAQMFIGKASTDIRDELRNVFKQYSQEEVTRALRALRMGAIGTSNNG